MERNIKEGRVYLNSKSVLFCENENDYEKHTHETTKILDYLGENAQAGAIIKIRHLDIAHRDMAPSYMYVPTENLYFNVLNSLDWKNGVDFVSENGEFAALTYGQNYTAYNYDKPFMERALVSYHFLDENQSEHMNFVKNSMEFIFDNDSYELEQGFLSVIYNQKEFFLDSEKIVNDLNRLNGPNLDEKINEAIQRKESEISKDNPQITPPGKE